MLSSLAVASLLSIVVAEPVALTMLDKVHYPHAKCLDGTQAGYYAQEASSEVDNTKWVIYLNGGGECDSEDACKGATEGALGSSKYFEETSDASGWYLGSDYCPKNPDLCSWNHVLDPYCTQDLHTGQVTRSELSDDNWHMYFSGHLVLEAILDDLDKRSNSLKNASEILLSGVSAGGLGVWTNVDYIAARYPLAKVTAATVAGFYFFATYYEGENHTDPGGMADFRESAFSDTYELYHAYVDQDCQQAMEASGRSVGACLVANVSYPFVQADSFVAQSQTDSVVLTGHDCWPGDYMYEAPEVEFMTEWYMNMTAALAPLMQTDEASIDGSTPRSGVFAAACYTHGGFTSTYPLINDMNMYTAFGNFYFNRTGPEGYKLSDDCGVMCNPTCQ